MTTASISRNHAPAIGECADDTQDLQCLFPIKPALNQRNQLGFAVHVWNLHSRCFQPAGTWHATKLEAAQERDRLLETLDEEVSA